MQKWQASGGESRVQSLREHWPWLLVVSLAVALLAVATVREPTPMPLSYADGRYRNLCCGDLLLAGGQLAYRDRRWRYTVAADAWSGSPLVQVQPGLAVAGGRVVPSGETVVLLAANREPGFGYLPPLAVILHENGENPVAFERVDVPFTEAAKPHQRRPQPS